MRRAPNLRSVCQDLVARHAVSGWWPAQSAFEVMVGAVLVQNTRWVNVERAGANLRDHAHLSPQAIASCASARLAQWVRPAGCQTVKSRRLIALARWVLARGGVRSLQRRATPALRAELLAVHGVGPETADAILCFAFERPVFIADRYARRWLARLGLFAHQTNPGYERCRFIVERRLGWRAEPMQRLHGAIVLFSQTICRSAPRCADCFLRKRCLFATGHSGPR
jgi:endonuclease-3 related protein